MYYPEGRILGEKYKLGPNSQNLKTLDAVFVSFSKYQILAVRLLVCLSLEGLLLSLSFRNRIQGLAQVCYKYGYNLGSSCEMVKQEERVVTCELRVQIYKSRVRNHKLQVKNHELRFRNCESPFKNY